MKLVTLGPLEARITGGTDGDGGGDGPVVILQHGFGAPGDDLVPLWRALAVPRGTRWVFPQAPIDLGADYMGGRAWWFIDIEARMIREARGEKRDPNEIPDGLVQARAGALAMLQDVERLLAPPPGKLVIGGFSQGAMLALDVALHGATPLAGVVLMSGTHIAAREWATRYEARRGLPVFMSHGTGDPLLPFADSEQLKNVLVAAGLPVDWVPFRGAHEIPPPVLSGVSTFLSRVLA